MFFNYTCWGSDCSEPTIRVSLSHLLVFALHMMTSSNGNIFRVTGILCGEFTGHRWIPTQRPVTRSFDLFFDLHQKKNSSVNNREAGDLRRHRAHYVVSLMMDSFTFRPNDTYMRQRTRASLAQAIACRSALNHCMNKWWPVVNWAPRERSGELIELRVWMNAFQNVCKMVAVSFLPQCVILHV